MAPPLVHRHVLLVQLGTPLVPDAAHVSQFLQQFLTDPAVVDLPMWLWKPLLKGVILPLRSKKVAKLYQKIWLQDGSPLAVHTENFAQALTAYAPEGTRVSVAYSYGCPRLTCQLRKAVGALRAGRIQRLDVIPLYPQYSGTTTQSVWNTLQSITGGEETGIYRFPPFYANPHYIQALSDSIAEYQAETLNFVPEKWLFSFHSLPEKRIRQGDPYVSHCEATATAVAQSLDFKPADWSIAYQSKFGFAPWVKPATTDTLVQWARQGITRVAILAPSFTADCLETLEELALQNQEAFLEAGGEAFAYIPALNDRPSWVRHFARMLEWETA